MEKAEAWFNELSKREKATISVLLLPTALVLKAFALSWLWWWFATPVFHINPPSLPNLLGLVLIFGYGFRGADYNYDPRPEWEKFTDRLGSALFNPFAVLAFGYVFRIFM